jgi:hypothetical protein
MATMPGPLRPPLVAFVLVAVTTGVDVVVDTGPCGRPGRNGLEEP